LFLVPHNFYTSARYLRSKSCPYLSPNISLPDLKRRNAGTPETQGQLGETLRTQSERAKTANERGENAPKGKITPKKTPRKTAKNAHKNLRVYSPIKKPNGLSAC
jgi:hypothetical protein